MNVFFDVQGTLVAGGQARPHAREAFEKISAAGHDVYLWSSGGASYAEHAARLLGVEDLVSGCFPKAAGLPVPVDFVVDDAPTMLRVHREGALVPPYAGDPDDRTLLGIADSIAEKPAT